MARFIGYVQGRRGEVSRLGDSKSGLGVSACGWELGVCVSASSYSGDRSCDNKNDRMTVRVTGGSNCNCPSKWVFNVIRNKEGKFFFEFNPDIIKEEARKLLPVGQLNML